jgi:hypothetical protein
MTPTHELQSPAPSLKSKKKNVFLKIQMVESHYNLKDISVKTTNVQRKLRMMFHCYPTWIAIQVKQFDNVYKLWHRTSYTIIRMFF